jgi:hypothetical protein
LGAGQELDPLRPLFKLNGLRNADAHNLGSSIPTELAEALSVFDIDNKQYMSGWGRGLDKLYDTVIASLNAMRALVIEALPETLTPL